MGNKDEWLLKIRIELATRVFWHYCLFMDAEFFSRRPYLKSVAFALELLHNKNIDEAAVKKLATQFPQWQLHHFPVRKISVSIPPRGGKSYITSLFCAWYIGKNPFTAIMRNSCTGRLYSKLSYDVLKIVKSEKNNMVFPDVMLEPDKQSTAGWNITSATQVTYFGAGTGGTIIGFGANLAISDDLYSGLQDALSETINEKTLLWKQSDHNSRMEGDCPELFIGTRWTKNDVIGKAIENGEIDIEITIPALDETGKSFCEDVKTTEQYHRIKSDIEEEIWEAEYQQNPINAKGVLLPLNELRFYNPKEIDIAKSEYIFMYVDPADDGGDYNSAPLAYLIGNSWYIDQVIFNKDGTDINIPRIVEVSCTKKINSATIEGNSAWILFAKKVREKINERWSSCDIRIVKSKDHKQTRILAQAAFIKNHFYFRNDYEQIPEYSRFIKNLTSYNRIADNKNDDAPDSMAGASDFVQRNFGHLY